MMPRTRYVYAIKDDWPVAAEAINRLRLALERAEARLMVERPDAATDADTNQRR